MRSLQNRKIIYKPVQILAICLAVGLSSEAQLPAFPGAEGFGRFATGGRGGRVVEVTNLNDTGTGSFRQAFLEYPGEPITIVFRVSGIIVLTKPIKVARSRITVAGQTAPGDGICLKGHSLIFNGAGQGGNHGNIIIRYIRSRPGATFSTGVYGLDVENYHDVIIDHCSASWANEECMAIYDTKNVTVQWSIFSEGLYNAGHAKGERSYCGVWGGQYSSFHHNLIAHQNNRTIRFGGARAHDTAALVDYRNNVVYNWGRTNACYGGEIEVKSGAYSHINYVNNFYKPGPATATPLLFVQPSTSPRAVGWGRWYIAGNVMDGDASIIKNNRKGVDLSALPPGARDSAFSDEPFEVNQPVALQSAPDAYKAVLKNVGASYPVRDAVDNRLVEETSKKTATAKGPSSGKWGIIDMPVNVGGWPEYRTYNVPADSDHDGMPDNWEIKHGLDPANAEDRNKTGDNGYTMLEIYLDSLLK